MSRLARRQVSYLAAALLLSLSAHASDTFDESLLIRPLPDGKVLSHFEFVTASIGETAWQGSDYGRTISTFQTSLLPRSLAALIRTYDVEEAHLSLTSGRWDYARWGEPVAHGSPSGGEMYAWLSQFEDEDTAAVEQKWRGLTNALGGLFCSSLNNLDSRMTVSPALTFSPALASTSASSPFFHALLPLERPCTENLTPLIAQLPCRASAGLATLLNPHRLFDANWQKLALHVVRDPESSNLNITLEFEVVQDPVRMTSALGAQARRDWSFETLFERPIDRACPVADSSVITVDLSKEDEESGYSLEPKASAIQLPTVDETAVYNVQTLSEPLNLHMRWPVMQREGFQFPVSYDPAPLIVERINTGYGLERNRLGIQIRNNAAGSIAVTWLEEWPWWIKVYMHTLRISVNGVSVAQDAILQDMRYSQAQARKRPTMIEARLSLPANSTTRLVLDVDKAYLWYTDYPPDSLRGFDVPSGVISISERPSHLDSGSSVAAGPATHKRRLYTTATLLDMPTPDFSMPYNVIILTCTVIVIFFGSVFNLLTRTWMLVDMRERPKEPVEGSGAVVADAAASEHTATVTGQSAGKQPAD